MAGLGRGLALRQSAALARARAPCSPVATAGALQFGEQLRAGPWRAAPTLLPPSRGASRARRRMTRAMWHAPRFFRTGVRLQGLFACGRARHERRAQDCLHNHGRGSYARYLRLPPHHQEVRLLVCAPCQYPRGRAISGLQRRTRDSTGHADRTRSSLSQLRWPRQTRVATPALCGFARSAPPASFRTLVLE